MSKAHVRPAMRRLRRMTSLQAAIDETDARLLQRFLDSRDESAFEVLIRRHGPMVLAVCRRVLGDRHDAEDAFQATFLTLARKGAAVSKRDRLGCWLHGVAYRTALEAKTLAARRHRRERPTAPPPDRPAAEPAYDPAWFEVLHRELDRLPERYREPVILCHLQGRPRRDAARLMSVPEGTLSSRLAKAMTILRERLHWYLPAAAATPLMATASEAARPSARLICDTARLASVGRLSPAVADPVTALSEGVMRTMFMSKVKLGLGTLLVAGLLAGATGLAPWGDSSATADEPAGPAPLAFDFAIDEPPSAELFSFYVNFLADPPAKEMTDEEFIRRLSLDLRGTDPTPLEVHYFVNDGDDDKRTKLVKLLLEEADEGKRAYLQTLAQALAAQQKTQDAADQKQRDAQLLKLAQEAMQRGDVGAARRELFKQSWGPGGAARGAWERQYLWQAMQGKKDEKPSEKASQWWQNVLGKQRAELIQQSRLEAERAVVAELAARKQLEEMNATLAASKAEREKMLKSLQLQLSDALAQRAEAQDRQAAMAAELEKMRDMLEQLQDQTRAQAAREAAARRMAEEERKKSQAIQAFLQEMLKKAEPKKENPPEDPDGR